MSAPMSIEEIWRKPFSLFFKDWALADLCRYFQDAKVSHQFLKDKNNNQQVQNNE